MPGPERTFKARVITDTRPRTTTGGSSTTTAPEGASTTT